MNIILFYIYLKTVITILLNIYAWMVIAYCIASMADGFGIINIRQNRFLASIFYVLARFVEPVLNRIRSFLPDTGMLDLSPLVVLILIEYAVPYILKQIFQLLYLSQGF